MYFVVPTKQNIPPLVRCTMFIPIMIPGFKLQHSVGASGEPLQGHQADDRADLATSQTKTMRSFWLHGYMD